MHAATSVAAQGRVLQMYPEEDWFTHMIGANLLEVCACVCVRVCVCVCARAHAHVCQHAVVQQCGVPLEPY